MGFEWLMSDCLVFREKLSIFVRIVWLSGMDRGVGIRKFGFKVWLRI